MTQQRRDAGAAGHGRMALAMAAGARTARRPATVSCARRCPRARAGCPLPAMPMQGGALSPEEELRAAVLHQLRETVVRQKETLGSPSAGHPRTHGQAGALRGAGRESRRRAGGASGRTPSGDLPQDPGHVVEQLNRSLQTLKDRLESLGRLGRGVPGGTLERAEEGAWSWPLGCAGHRRPGALGCQARTGFGPGRSRSGSGLWLSSLLPTSLLEGKG